MSSLTRWMAALAMVATFALGLGGAPATSAQSGTGTVIWHFRECPPGAYDVFAECHDNGIAGVPTRMVDENGVEAGACTTDANGNCIYANLVPGNYGAYVDDLDLLDTLLGVYCSNEEDLGNEIYYSTDSLLPVAAGDVIYCDLYFLGDAPADGGKKDDGGSADDGGKADDGGTQMPDTGVGVVAGGSAALTLVTSGLALLGGGVALRRRRS